MSTGATADSAGVAGKEQSDGEHSALHRTWSAMSPRQRRGLLLLLIASAGAVLSFVTVLQYTASVAEQLGPRRPVVVVAREVPAYAPILEADLQVRLVPVVFAPPAALDSADAVSGRVSPVALPAGTFLQDAALVDPPALAAGERAVTVLATGEQSLARSLAVGDVLDVVAGYPGSARGEATARVEVDAARVLSVAPPKDEEDAVFVTLAVSPADGLALARAQASDASVVVVRHPPQEVEP